MEKLIATKNFMCEVSGSLRILEKGEDLTLYGFYLEGGKAVRDDCVLDADSFEVE